MKKWINFLLVLCTLIAMCGVGWYVYTYQYRRILTNDIATANFDRNLYRPYVFGTVINFAADGNSADYVQSDNGWGDQEPAYRCTVGKNTTVHLYIPDGAKYNLRLVVNAMGVYPIKTASYQEIAVYTNDVHVATWHVSGNDSYRVDIPRAVMMDNTLTIRFEAAAPYCPPVDNRRLGMAVNQIQIERVIGAQLKRKLGRWFKNYIIDLDNKYFSDASASLNDL